MNYRITGQSPTHPSPSIEWSALILVISLGLSGCSIWDGYEDPDYRSSRAEQVCHPYGQCSQGKWVARDGMAKDPHVAKVKCRETIDQQYGNRWWNDSVAKGLEIGRCMEKKGFQLQQR